MTESEREALARGCLGLPLRQALAVCRAAGWEPRILYTGERAAQADLTPRVIAFRPDALIVSLFRDGDPREEP